MHTLLLILFDLFVVWFFFGQSLQRWLAPKPFARLLLLRDTERHFRHLFRRDRDILPDDQKELVRRAAEVLHSCRTGRRHRWSVSEEDMAPLVAEPCFAALAKGVAKDGLEGVLHEMVEKVPEFRLFPVPKASVVTREYLEIAVVALGLAFGVRALFLQPFKIPTGSMQPTLFGIHFIHSEEGAPRLGPVGRFFGYLHYSRRYVDYTVQKSGWLDMGNVREIEPFNPLGRWIFPRCSVNIGDVSYLLPGSKDVVEKYLYSVATDRARKLGPDKALQFAKGELFLRGYLESGDHLFVDRTYLPFHEPKRGDVTVFRTDHIIDIRGRGLNGPYYIKRLVGMPGDELRVHDRHLQVRRPGETEFRSLDGTDHPGFTRIYSGKGGYRGHSYSGGFCFADEADVLYIPRQDDLLKVDPQTGQFSIRKVGADDFEPYRRDGWALPIQATGMQATLQWLDTCGWFDQLEANVYRFRYDHYLLMGDNTDNSSDGRTWGTIPRENLVGRAAWVWWPFTRRWGRADRLPPLDFPSPPTPFDLNPLGADADE